MKAMLAGVFCAALFSRVVLGSDIYVSPDGSDSNSGTANQPVQTLQRARDLVRTQNAAMSGDLVVHLLDGNYRLNEPLTLTAQDSGMNGHNVIYRADHPGKVVISGGVAVSGWAPSDSARNLWSAPVPAGLANTRQLYVDGVRARRASGILPCELQQTADGYTASDDAMSHWRNPSDIEFVYTGGNPIWGIPSVGLGPWTEPRIPVASINGTTIVMVQPCWNNSTNRADLKPQLAAKFKRSANLVGPARVGKVPALVENAFEMLKDPGQWYFDRSAKVIYYIPRPGDNLKTADVEAPVLEQLVVGNGSESAPISNVQFEGIQFSYATWLYPSSEEGFSEIQANYMVTGKDGAALQGLADLVEGGKQPFGDWTKTPGNVAFQYDHNIRFVRDAFAHLGAAGLELGNGSKNDVVEGCVFTDISGNGVELGGVDLPEGNDQQATSDNRIANNHIYDMPVEFHGGVGICVGYTQRSDIEHNQLDHMAYTGISLGWGGWPDKIEQPGIPNNSQNVVVANNLIFNHMLILADGGGIYTQGLTGPDLKNGEKVRDNVVRDQFNTGHAIYSDNGSANMTITGNVMVHTNFDNWGTAHKNYYNGLGGTKLDWIDVESNYWQQGNPDDSSKEYLTLRGNHLVAGLSDVPQAVLGEAGLQQEYHDILSEQFSKPTAPEPPSRVGTVLADGAAYVTWDPVVVEGSSPVMSYTVTPPGGQPVSVSVEQFVRDGFAKIPGATGPCEVIANNSVGASSPAYSYAAVKPKENLRPPGAPTIGVIHITDGKASVHFMAPEDDGGSPILAYQCTISPGDRKIMITGRGVISLAGRHQMFYVFDGIEDGKQYTFSLAGVNSAGVGAAAKKSAD
jgi:hypothetical protein